MDCFGLLNWLKVFLVFIVRTLTLRQTLFTCTATALSEQNRTQFKIYYYYNPVSEPLTRWVIIRNIEKCKQFLPAHKIRKEKKITLYTDLFTFCNKTADLFQKYLRLHITGFTFTHNCVLWWWWWWQGRGGHLELRPFTDQVMNIYRICHKFSEGSSFASMCWQVGWQWNAMMSFQLLWPAGVNWHGRQSWSWENKKQTKINF